MCPIQISDWQTLFIVKKHGYQQIFEHIMTNFETKENQQQQQWKLEITFFILYFIQQCKNNTALLYIHVHC